MVRTRCRSSVIGRSRRLLSRTEHRPTSGLKLSAALCKTRVSAFVADDASTARTYRHSTITNQPRLPHQKKSLATVSLTPAEARVLTLLTTYRTLSAIGTQLGIGRPTVKTHVHNIYRKLGATDRAEAVKLAEDAGLLPHL
jgi:DNA-binding NarL/FixJ family response regulator